VYFLRKSGISRLLSSSPWYHIPRRRDEPSPLYRFFSKRPPLIVALLEIRRLRYQRPAVRLRSIPILFFSNYSVEFSSSVPFLRKTFSYNGKRFWTFTKSSPFSRLFTPTAGVISFPLFSSCVVGLCSLYVFPSFPAPIVVQ